ncbi:MAG: YfhO family protein [bacterium]
MKNYKNLFAISVIFILPIIFFWRIIFLNETLFVGDIISLNYPSRVFVRDCIREGILPLWCPYIYCGFPLLAEGQAGVFYPLNLILFTLLEPVTAFNLSVILHFSLAGLFMFMYLRIIKCDQWSALLAGITFMFSGVFITHLIYFNMLTIYVWLPLILYLIEISFLKKGIRYIIFIGVIFGMQFLGGYPQASLQILLVVTAYLLFKTIKLKRLVIIFLIASGIYAIQLFPTYELLRESYRSQPIPYYEWVLTSLSLPQLITFILPDFFGNPFKGIYVGDWNYIDLCGYLGIIPLIFGIMAISLKRDKYTFFSLAICLLGLLLAFGKYNPLYNLLYHFPIISSIRYPARYLYLWTFGMSVLAGLGFNYLLENQSIKKRLVIFTCLCFNLVSIFSLIWIYGEKDILYSIMIKDWLLFMTLSTLSFSLLILYLKYKITRSIFASLSIVVLIVNIFIYWSGFNPTVKKSILTSTPQSVRFLKKDKSLYRIITWDWKEKYKDPIARSNITKLKPFTEVITPVKESITPNLSLLYKISSIDGWLPLNLSRYIEFSQILNFKLFSLINGKYIITSKDTHIPHPLVFSNEAINIYENKTCLPRAFIVHQAKVIKDKETILHTLKSEDFYPGEYVILEEEIDKKISPQLKNTKEKVKITKYFPLEVKIEASLSRAGFLVLTDTYYPNWEVYVNNKKEKIYRADFLFRAVPLPAGNFSLRFVYNPVSFNLGAKITVITLIFLGGLYIFGDVLNPGKRSR